MKNTRKILIALLVMMTLFVGMFAINASAATEANTTIYLKPNANWMDSNPWFAVYTWDVSPNWYKMSDNDGDGIYECTLPAGVTNVIFCRMNPDKTAMDWDSRWDQTQNLQYTGSNCFTVKEGDWNNATGTWSNFTPTHTHSWVKGTEKAPTCTEAGTIPYSCECTATKEEAIPALHTSLTGTCSVCGFDLTKVSVLYLKNTAGWVNPQCYSWDGNGADNAWPGVAMTLVADDVYKVEIAAGFKFVIFHNKVDAGEGLYEGVQTADLLVPANGCVIFNNNTNEWAEYHNPVTTEGKAPTCKEPGLTEGSKCSDCGKVLVEATEIPVTADHSYESSVQAPTCTETGLNTFTCSVCGHSYTEEIPVLDHDYDESEWGFKSAEGHAHVCACGAKSELLPHIPNIENPTETIAKYCVDCEYVIEAALGHECDLSVLKFDADGHWYKCTGCEATSEKAAHTGGAATCEDAAKCSVCEQSYGVANGHSFADATCTAPKTCSVCGTTDGEALGHGWTNATCTTPKTCAACGATEGEANGHDFVKGKCHCGAEDPDYVPEETVDPNETPNDDQQPTEEPELSLIDQIIKAITEFFAQIIAWFENLFA